MLSDAVEVICELPLYAVLRSRSLLRVTRKKYEGRAIPGEESPALLVAG
jgi:hypothetical protein